MISSHAMGQFKEKERPLETGGWAAVGAGPIVRVWKPAGQVGIRPFRCMRSLGRTLPVCLVALCLGWSWMIHAQDQTPTFRAESDVVLVDLIVTDRKGNSVDDLKRKEVELFEDGKRQNIRFFRLERKDGHDRRDQTREVSDRSSGSPGGRSDGDTSSAVGGYYAFLMDLQAMDHNSLERSKDSIRAFLRSEIDPRDRIMLATIRPQFRVDQSFTRDLTKLTQALDQISYRREKANLAQFALDLLEGRASSRMSPREYLDVLAMQIDLSSRALSALSRHLGSLPGRKHVLYFSNGYPLNAALRIARIMSKAASARMTGRGMASQLGGLARSKSPLFFTTRELTEKLRSAVDRANRNQVSVHSIDPRGLMVVPFELGTVLDIGDLEASQEFLAQLSKDTGGLLATNENDLLRPIREAYRDGRTYYLLGYVPDTKRKIGKFHEITVRVRREGLQLRHRRGYMDQDPLVAAQSELANAFKFPDLYRDFPFDLDVVPKGGKLGVRARVPTNVLRFTSEGEKSRCLLEIFGVVFDEFDGPTGKEFFLTKNIDLDFDAKGLETFRSYEALGPWMEKDFPKKGNYLVVVLRQKLTGELAAGKAALEMAKLAD